MGKKRWGYCCALCLCLLCAPVRAQEGAAAWITYWDVPGTLEEAAELGGRIETLVYFAAYFDQDNIPFVPEALYEVYDETAQVFSEAMPLRYLSVVNDKRLSDGSSLLKDTRLLKDLLSTPKGREAHAQELISLARFDGFDGIEIDYEAIRNDSTLWGQFSAFIWEIDGQAQKAGLGLRVLLEPGAPLADLDLPRGPEYVMMCYNLHGGHNGPGPKADDAFLRSLVKKMEKLPPPRAYALATGGFDWTQSRNAVSITQREAEKLAEAHGADARRDDQSGALFFSYKDQQGRQHEVWYADAETLGRWGAVIGEAGGEAVDVWRLGGNVGIAGMFDFVPAGQE